MSELSVGRCPEHQRQYEGFCKLCYVVVCPSCVMFGAHKKHDILTLKQGAMFIRREIDNGMSKGLLKKEATETKILSIRENGLIIEKSKTETVQKLEATFKGIIHCLKARKELLINEINQKFNEQRQKIEDAESDWCCKEDIIEKMTQFNNEKNDAFLLSNSKFIMEGLRKLNEKLTFTEIEIYNNIGTDLKIELPLKHLTTNNDDKEDKEEKEDEKNEDKNNEKNEENIQQQNIMETEGSKNNSKGGEPEKVKVFSLDDIIDAFSNYIVLGPPNVINYKA